ncbi:hypothetical protein [Niallia sp. Man26]|uniref:hypothetical protein n=1 Tax=unclassified Niallia TaxID=2837522 RepID=UPI001EDC33FE|nr:hypothetical protein [Niallia sp. Man26]UPO89664.1 hypothetical protein L8T27_022900 [Niallia sp. Man26]
MKRKWEVIIGLAGVILCVILLGGFSLTITTMEEKTFADTVFPILQEDVSTNYLSESFTAVKALAVWFGVTVLIVLSLTLPATVCIWKNRYPKWAAFLYLAAGLTTLIGTQFIAFPLAFLFFIAASLCLFRKIKNGEGADYVSIKSQKSNIARV